MTPVYRRQDKSVYVFFGPDPKVFAAPAPRDLSSTLYRDLLAAVSGSGDLKQKTLERPDNTMVSGLVLQARQPLVEVNQQTRENVDQIVG
jgi:hypothetical protein